MLLSAGLWEHEKQQAICRNNTSDKDCSRIYEYVGHAIIPPIASVITPPRNQKPERDQWRSEQDLKAQWEMARFTLWAAFAAWAGVFVTIVGIFYIRQTLEANRAAVSTAEIAVAVTRETAERQLRAYVHVEKADIFGKIDSDEAPRFQIRFKNYGLTPAHRVSHTCGITLVFGGKPTLKKPEVFKYSDLGPSQGRFTTLYTSDVVWPLMTPGLDGSGTLYLIGEIAYSDVFQMREGSSEGRYTPYRLRVVRAESGNGILLIADEGNEST